MHTTELNKEDQTIRLSPAPAPFSHHGKADPRPLPIHTMPKCARRVQEVMFPITPHSPTNVPSWFQILQLHCCPGSDWRTWKAPGRCGGLSPHQVNITFWQVTTHSDSSRGALFTWHLISWKACDLWGCPYPSDPAPWTWPRGELKSVSACALLAPPPQPVGKGWWLQWMTLASQIE